MSFSASTCLTNIGTTPLSSTLRIYSNPTSPTSPGTFVSLVLTDDITGGNCPYTFEVPNGTTSIRLSDPISGCYCDIPVSDNNLCATCDLNFDYYLSPNVGNIVAGDISGTCDNNITDYLIYWYKNTDPDTMVFSSGKGTEFVPYLYQHPLTGPSAVIATSGTYNAVLQKIKINGIVFSLSGEPGTVLADLDCLPSITNGDPILVEALTCDNGDGSSDLPQYEHKFAYNATTSGVPPQPLSTTFSLSAATNYFVWRFKGFTVPDEIRFTLSGSSYPVPILLDYWKVGVGIPENLAPDAFPKVANTDEFFGKPICLTGFTINNGDEILIEVIPSITNPQTSWTLYCSCLDIFDCDVCKTAYTATTVSGTTSYQYPIKESTINVNSGTCYTTVSFSVSGDCDYNVMINSDLFKYAGEKRFHYLDGGIDNLIDYSSNQLYFNRYVCYQPSNANPNNNINTSGCLSLGSGIDITYEKSDGLFKVTSNDLSTIDTYFYQPYLGVSTLISPFSGDNTNIGYYQYFNLYYMDAVSTQNCGDGVDVRTIRISQTSVVTTGQTGSDYYISFTLPLMTDGITFPDCYDCDSTIQSVVLNVNYDSEEYLYTGTTNLGVVYNNPIPYMRFVTGNTETSSDGVFVGYKQISNTQNETYPASGSTTYDLIPSLSAVTCSNLLGNFFNPYSTTYLNHHFLYRAGIFDPTNRENFRIYATEIKSDGEAVSATETLIYEYSGGTVTIKDTEYFV